MEETLAMFQETLLNIYFNILEFCVIIVTRYVSLFLLFFKYDWYHQFKLCVDLIGYDRPGKIYRFTIIYYLLSLVYNTRIHIITQTDELQGVLSNYMLYKSLN